MLPVMRNAWMPEGYQGHQSSQREEACIWYLCMLYECKFRVYHIRGILRQPDRSWSVLYLVFPLYAGWK